MRKNSPTECKDCEKPISQNKVGAARIRCDACAIIQEVRRASAYYVKHLRPNQEWHRINKARAKAWRDKNQERVVQYRARRKGEALAGV
jgi:hypothetical protein